MLFFADSGTTGLYTCFHTISLPDSRPILFSNGENAPACKGVTGVRYVDAKTGQAELVRADLVFLCASAMASVQILMNSRAPGSDRSWFDTSGTLGHYVMDHIFRTGVSGEIPGMTEYIEYGRRPEIGRASCRERVCQYV